MKSKYSDKKMRLTSERIVLSGTRHLKCFLKNNNRLVYRCTLHNHQRAWFHKILWHLFNNQCLVCFKTKQRSNVRHLSKYFNLRRCLKLTQGMVLKPQYREETLTTLMQALRSNESLQELNNLSGQLWVWWTNQKEQKEN